MSCVEGGWRRRAVVEQLGDPQLLIAGVIGVGLMVAGIVAPGGVPAVTAAMVGTGLVTVFAVYPLLSAATLGDGGFNLSLSKDARQAVVSTLYEEHAGRVQLAATQLWGSDAVDPAVTEVMKAFYEVAPMVPREERLRYLMCELVDAVAGHTGVAALLAEPPAMPDDDSVGLAALAFDHRCVIVLKHTARLDTTAIAAIMQLDTASTEVLVATAEAALHRQSHPEG